LDDFLQYAHLLLAARVLTLMMHKNAATGYTQHHVQSMLSLT